MRGRKHGPAILAISLLLVLCSPISRSIGSRASTPGKSATRLFELARELASPKETVQGVWLRQIVLENPKPPRR